MNEKKPGGRLILLIPALLILLAIVFIVVRLVIWDRSGNVELEEIEAGTYDYESLDIVFSVDADVLKEHGDDGTNDIVLIGNSYAVFSPSGPTIADMIAGMPDTKLTTLCYYYGQIADAANAYNNDDVSVWQAANLFEIVKALCTKDYSLQKRALDEEKVVTGEFYDALISTDLDKIDEVIIMYDSIDYRNSSVLYNPADKYDTSTYEGALRAAITRLQSDYPHLKIIVASPYLHGIIDDNGTDFTLATMKNYGNGNLSEYVMREYNIAMECCVSYADNFFGLITEKNVLDNCDKNTVYGLNENGIKLIGGHMTDFISRKY